MIKIRLHVISSGEINVVFGSVLQILIVLCWRMLSETSFVVLFVNVAARNIVRVCNDCTMITFYGGRNYSNVFVAQFVGVDSV